ncbi:MAG: Gfo/Idh/MocA family oxidoreductase [Verrucomicrobia bacterium]|nr:Gfo/Idh/MocA family oxidoreductase [Verrucomicrobiota bacterium]
METLRKDGELSLGANAPPLPIANNETHDKTMFESSIIRRGPKQAYNRRQFITGAGAAALGLTLIKPTWLSGAEANTKLEIGLIGCGGRGKWIADLFMKSGQYNLVAVADYFQERADEAGKAFNVPEGRRYAGLSGYKRLLEQKLDAVVIETPPYFHPQQTADAIAAGKHVYCAKPISVDVPGCLSMGESGRKATEKKLVLLVDFQTRAHPSYQEAVKRVHAGAIGKIISGEATYQTGQTWGHMDKFLLDHPGNVEARLRGWGADRTFSGDVITEQNIHALDVAAWILNANPVKAYGCGGRRRVPVPNGCWDYFSVVFYYPDEVLLSFSSKQVGKGWDDIQCRVYGMEGTIDTHYFGEVKVVCDDKFNGGLMGNLYTEGVVKNIATFHESIVRGDFSNPTVAPSVRSNLTTILGRTAAYKKSEVTWEEMMQAREKWEVDLKGLKA